MSSSKKRTTQNVTNISTDNSAIVEDSGLNATDGGVGIRDSDNVLLAEGSNVATGEASILDIEAVETLTITDVSDEIVTRALEFGETAISTVNETNERVFDLAEDQTSQAFRFADDVLASTDQAQLNTLKLAQDAISTVSADAEDRRTSESQALIENIIKFGSLAAVGIAGLTIYAKRK